MKNLIIVIVLLTFSVESNAQVQSLTKFKDSIKNLSEKEAFESFDDRIVQLTKTDAPDSSFYNTLNAQYKYAIASKNQPIIEFTALQLIEYPGCFKKKRLYDFLLYGGGLSMRKGNQDKAMSCFLRARDVAEELNNDTLITSINKEIGISFSNMANFDLAKKYLFSSLTLAEQMNYNRGIAGVCMTIGNVYKNTDQYDSAKFYYEKSIKFSKLCNFRRGISGNYNNLGNLCLKQELYPKAIEYFLEASIINQDLGHNVYLSKNYANLAQAYYDTEDNDKALFYVNKAIKLPFRVKDSIQYASNLFKRSKILATKKEYKKAYTDLKLAKRIVKKYANKEKLVLAADVEANFNNAKKEALIKQLQAEQKSQAILITAREEELKLENQLQKENDLILWGFGIVLLGLIVAMFAFWRNGRQRKKYTEELYVKNNEIETVNSSLNEAKEVLTVKNEEILDSISYAKRIQAAILPSKKHLHEALDDAFVLYLPKDIVAGDFYWTEKVGNTVLFAVADCTGHGVPGAMVSVICNNALNETIKLKNISDPGEILDYTTDNILKQFEKAEDNVKDGMDIGLCAFDQNTRTLKYAGANIPLWIVRNNEVVEIKATRQPVGNFVLRKKFKTNEIEIQDGDTIYMSSDGFADQFGGDRNKKYMKKNFKNLLLKISTKPLEQQNALIEETFSDWKLNNEQVDDICVMGVKFKAS